MRPSNNRRIKRFFEEVVDPQYPAKTLVGIRGQAEFLAPLVNIGLLIKAEMDIRAILGIFVAPYFRLLISADRAECSVQVGILDPGGTVLGLGCDTKRRGLSTDMPAAASTSMRSLDP